LHLWRVVLCHAPTECVRPRVFLGKQLVKDLTHYRRGCETPPAPHPFFNTMAVAVLAVRIQERKKKQYSQ
jgi:hypothetical protein